MDIGTNKGKKGGRGAHDMKMPMSPSFFNNTVKLRLGQVGGSREIVTTSTSRRFFILPAFLLVVIALPMLLVGTVTVSAYNDIGSISSAAAPPQLPQSPVKSGTIIINHTTCNLSLVPRAAIEEAKSSLNIAYGHTSHGSQLITGMDGLQTFAGAPNGGALYTWNEDGSNGALQIDDYAMDGDLGSPDRITWANETRAYLKSHQDVNVIMWSWCGEVSSATASDINSYLNTMSQLEAEYPNVKFVYMTGHLDGSGVSGNLNQRNEQIRNYCRANSKTLFDFADIESYDPDGKYFLDKYANDNCEYYNSDSSTSNWAIAWENNHTEGVDWYQCDPAHTQALNGNLKAYAAWWLFARMAGWAGPNSTQSTQVPYTLSLGKGWNLVSLPVQNGSSWSGDISGSSGVDKVSVFNGNTQSFSNYIVGASSADKNIQFVPDKGYFINCTRSTTLTFRGVKVDGPRTLTLNPGWNMVGWTPAYNSTAKTFGSLNPHINKVSKFSTATSLYTTYIVGASGDDKNFQMTNGNGYFVYNNATTTITVTI